jgi:hypothetical protein
MSGKLTIMGMIIGMIFIPALAVLSQETADSLINEPLPAEDPPEEIVISEKKPLFTLGLSFSVNYDPVGEFRYMVLPDSTIGQYTDDRGFSGMISAVGTVRLIDSIGKGNERRSCPVELAFNFPLAELLLGSDNPVAVFNKRVAMGIGIAWIHPVHRYSLCFIVNFLRVSRITEICMQRKVEDQPGAEISTEGMSCVTESKVTFSAGIIIPFNR